MPRETFGYSKAEAETFQG